jgi:hypothetical protein
VRPELIIAVLIVGSFNAMPQTNEPPKKSPPEVMRELRLKMLTTPPAELGQKTSPEYPRVHGVLMDWPIERGTVSVISLSSGDASIYTTGTFGVIGGVGHETVRDAARNFVKVAEKHYDKAPPTKDYSYPNDGRIRFYLTCHDGVRSIDADLATLKNGTDKCSDLFVAGQRVITELRLTTQNPKGQQP